MIFLLQPFYAATCELEGEKEPAIHLVLPWITKLERHCQVTDDDCEEIEVLKKLADSFIKVKTLNSIIINKYLLK